MERVAKFVTQHKETFKFFDIVSRKRIPRIFDNVLTTMLDQLIFVVRVNTHGGKWRVVVTTEEYRGVERGELRWLCSEGSSCINERCRYHHFFCGHDEELYWTQEFSKEQTQELFRMGREHFQGILLSRDDRKRKRDVTNIVEQVLTLSDVELRRKILDIAYKKPRVVEEIIKSD